MEDNQDEKSKNYRIKNHIGPGISGRIWCHWIKSLPYVKSWAGVLCDYATPEHFCDEAWKAIYQYVFALAHGDGKSLFYYGDWIRKPGVAICSCNDGLRPVIFKLEATEEESEINYIPIQ